MKSCIIGRGQEVFNSSLSFFGPDFLFFAWLMAQILIDMSPDWFEVNWLINFFNSGAGIQ